MKQKSQMRALISTSSFAQFDTTPLDILEKHNVAYVLNPYQRKMQNNELVAMLGKYNFVGVVAGTELWNKNLIKMASHLKVISRVGVGIDNIDTQTASIKKIIIRNTPNVLTDAVAELTLALILDCLRKVTLHHNSIVSGVWKKQMGMLLKGKTIGLVGYGNIGKRVGILAKAFGAVVIYCDKRKNIKGSATRVSFRTLLKQSDIVSVHVSEKNEIFNKDVIAQMKDGVVFINVSRGSVLNEAALYDALQKRKVAYAGLDVFEKEPYVGPLRECDNVVLTAHIGSYAKEARIAMEIEAVNNLITELRKCRLL